MGLETEGKKVMLQAFGTAAVKVDLHNASDQVLSGDGYAQQTISWTYDGTDVILEADAVGVGKGLLNQEAKELLRQWLLGGVNIS